MSYFECKGTKKLKIMQYHNHIIPIYQTLGIQLHHNGYCLASKIVVPLQPKIISNNTEVFHLIKI